MMGFKFEEALKLLVKYFPEEKMKKPTLYHSIRVGVYLWNNFYDEDLQIAGLLHDALEDTNIKEKTILDNFGEEILLIVKANSKNENIPKNERLKDIIKRCNKFGEKAMIVKMADIYDNFLFYTRENNISEIERCKRLTKLVQKYKKSEWKDKIFEKIGEILNY